jgi:hypothetical protein
MNNGIEIDPAAALTGAGVAGITFFLLFLIALGVFLQLIAWAGMWKSASKAGQFGLLACIPIVNFFIWAIMAKKEA